MFLLSSRFEPAGFSLSVLCFSYSVSKVPSRCSYGPAASRRPPSRDAASRRRRLLCWPQTFKELRFQTSLVPSPFPVRKRVQKYGFFRCPQHFFQTFFQETCIALGYSEIKMRFFPGRPRKGGLFRGGKAVPDRLRGPKRRVQGTTWRTNNARTAGAEKEQGGTLLINICAYITQKMHTPGKQKSRC